MLKCKGFTEEICGMPRKTGMGLPVVVGLFLLFSGAWFGFFCSCVCGLLWVMFCVAGCLVVVLGGCCLFVRCDGFCLCCFFYVGGVQVEFRCGVGGCLWPFFVLCNKT